MSDAFEMSIDARGATRVRARRPLGTYARAITDDLRAWADATPDATFVAERAPDGSWRRLTYGDAMERARTIGAGLLQAGASADAPLGIVAENGIDHASLTLAAFYVGVPVAPISVGYASPDAARGRLDALIEKLAPALVFAGDARIAERIPAGIRTIRTTSELAGDAAEADVAARDVSPDTIAKIMFTSGSTGTPKGVITTHGMLCSNQVMLSAVWPELSEELPLIVDWLPWSHCFGGSHNFGLVLHHGGSLYVDAGRPAPGAFETTVANVGELGPNVFFCVPRGAALLVERLNADASFARTFFSHVRVICNAGASIPDALRGELFRFATLYAKRPVRITSSWGTTELAPLATTSWGPNEPDIDTIGTPVPGVEIKLAPAEGRAEIRVKGPNVTPGYWRDADATRAAFDEDGYYRTGDAARLKDPTDASRGFVFEGRLAENFKLTSGTWVNVGALRLALIERGAPLIEEVVVSGHDRDAISVLLFVSRVHAAKLAEAAPDASHAAIVSNARVRNAIARLLAEHNAAMPAGSTRVVRALVVPESPNRAEGEITDKGSVNQRRSLELRAALVKLVETDPIHADVVVPAAAGVLA